MNGPIFSSILNGQVTIAEDNVPVAFSSSSAWVTWINMHAYLHNISPVKTGNAEVTCNGSATDGRAITPGEEMILTPILDLGDLYAVGRAGDRIDWVAGDMYYLFYYMFYGV